ncbi:hypothetical protein T440DRAFT_461331 [Plenodomus tracheiphilus IPT5]|uniref:Uncharacterized protein n=1 Tax=Plenodomus tracheiphilus IPT5 TaxID=1408161 RepID=A0A6A7AP65_9PLEO|nr:hypothetical protein T440DRAFT_461331 [Plenodomus tracheiphilus IPT5]
MAHQREENPFLRPSQDGLSTTAASKNSSTSNLPLVSTQAPLRPRRNLYSTTIMVTSVYSTLCSALFFIVALVQPKYGRIVSKDGRFSPSSAALLTQFIAKTIELSFVMVFLVFIGQVLSRRAIQQKGVNLASIAMRSWILQPGTLFTQWHSVRFAGLSALGVLSLITAVLSLLYTTAAGALVQPQLRLAPWRHQVLAGEVQSDFSDTLKARKTCLNAWPDVGDIVYGGSTCLAVEWSSLCGRNFARYLSKWDDKTARKDPPWMSDQLEDRLPVFAALDDSIPVTTTWLDQVDMKSESDKAGRIVNNITIAVPHRGVPAAARHPHNNLLQPEDLQGGGGSYTVRASVASFALNVLCVNANRSELEPIVYETWPNAVKMENTSMAVNYWPIQAFPEGTDANNKTVLDDVFGWHDEDDDPTQARPVFLKFPIDANTLANHTATGPRPAAYLLGKAPDGTTDDYFLCSMKTGVTTSCTTRYNASSEGQSLEALCANGARSQDDDAMVPPTVGSDRTALSGWLGMAFDLLNSISLNNGVFDGDASTARILTQLQLKEPVLNKTLPSPAEGLASIMMCTVLDLTQNFPFEVFDNYSAPALDESQLQYFNASIRVAQYMSGGEKTYQKLTLPQAFLVVLGLTLLINIFILVYLSLILRVKLITDLCEPLVLFILGYHSAPGDLFGEVALQGPKKNDWARQWIVKREDGQTIVTGMDQTDQGDGSKDDERGFRLRSRTREEEPMGAGYR